MMILINFSFLYIGRIAMSRKNNYGKISKGHPSDNYNANKIKIQNQNYDLHTSEDTEVDTKIIIKNKSKNDILIIINNLENILDSNDVESQLDDGAGSQNDDDYNNELKFFNDNFKIENKEKIFDILKFKDVCLLSFDCVEKISKWTKNEEYHDLNGMFWGV
jgi:hypothetical protein